MPLVHLRINALNDFEDLRRKLESKNFTYEDNRFNDLRANLVNSGSVDYCTHKIGAYVNEAVSTIKQLNETRYKHYLIEMAESLRTSNDFFSS